MITNKKVVRGGSWLDYGSGVRCAARDWGFPDSRHDFVGFRLVVLPKNRENFRVLRGGSFALYDYVVRCADRGRINPLLRFSGIGFRVVALPKKKKNE